METIILHSKDSEASRNLVSDCADSMFPNVTVIDNHEAAIAACPNFSAYPTVLHDGRVLSPAESWEAAVEWINSPPAPTPAPRVISQFAFSRLFTKAERIAIRQAAKVNADVEDFLDILDRAGEVDLDLQDTVDGVMAMEAASLIGTGRAVRILANIPPVE